MKIYSEIAYNVFETLLNKVKNKIKTNDMKITKRKIDLIISIDLTRMFLICNSVIAKKAKNENDTQINEIL